MSAASTSSICLPCGKSDFVSTDEENFFITASKNSWMEHVKRLYAFEPLTIAIGKIVIRAFCFEEGIGLFSPDTSSLISKASSLGLDVRNEVKLMHLIKTLPHAKSDIFLSEPLKICNLTSGSFHVITQKKCIAVELTQTQIPVEFLPVSKPLHAPMQCLSNISRALTIFRSRFAGGSYRLINEPLIERVSKLFFEFIPFFETFLSKEHPIELAKTSDDMQMIASKNPRSPLDIYILFNRHYWRGSYKIVMQGIKLSDKILPIGASISDTTETESEAKKEVAFRRHPHISRVLTPLFLHWKAEGQDNMIHSWACFGSLQDFLKKQSSIPLATLDTLALQMLESLDVFHSHGAVHKDLTSDNFIVDGTDGRIKLFINDVGSSSFADDPKELNTVATHGYNMAPELAQKCMAVKGHFWQSVFEVPLSFEDWVLSERFQIANLIAKLYLGKTPFEIASERKEILDQFPAVQKHFTDFISQPSCHLLDKYLEEEDRAALIRAYDLAYLQYFPTLAGNEGIDPEHLEGEAAFTYLSSFLELYNSENRVRLNPYLKNVEDIIKPIYKKAFKTMNAQFQKAFWGALNVFIASNKTPILGLIPEAPPKIKARLEAIAPLFELDKGKRPDLKVAIALLQTAIHLNP
jgi:Protein kinase domain